MNSVDRERIKWKFGGYCAYCGKALEDNFHIDHVEPIYRGYLPKQYQNDTDENKFPSCPRCNRWKGVLSVEKFRAEIEAQILRLIRDSAGFRLASDFKLISLTNNKVVFHFEKKAGVS